MKLKDVVLEILAIPVPGIPIYLLLQTYGKPPADLAKNILGLTAPTISIFFAAASFLYSQYSHQIATYHTKAALMLKADVKTEKPTLLSPMYFPRAFTRAVL